VIGNGEPRYPLAYAAGSQHRPVEEIIRLVAGDRDLLALFQLVTERAADTRLDWKLFALGRVLANVLEDNAKLDLNYTVADAIGVIEPSHLKTLAYLDQFWKGQVGQAIDIYGLHEALPELGLGLRSILTALQSKALVSEHVEYGEPDRAPRIGAQAASLPLMSVAELRRLWIITEFGHAVLARITAAADEYAEATGGTTTVSPA
jgi:hypothetical protein